MPGDAGTSFHGCYEPCCCPWLNSPRVTWRQQEVGLKEEKSKEQQRAAEVIRSHEEMSPKREGQPLKEGGMAAEMEDAGAALLGGRMLSPIAS